MAHGHICIIVRVTYHTENGGCCVQCRVNQEDNVGLYSAREYWWVQRLSVHIELVD